MCVCVQVVVRLSDELLSQAVMVVESCRPTLTINLAGARQHWLEGMLRHEIGNHTHTLDPEPQMSFSSARINNQYQV